MIDLADSQVRGWCPGALRPMESGDGLIVRVRPRAGAIPLSAVGAICEAAIEFGNGHIDLTRRANLQIRGVRADTLQPLLDVLAAHRLLDTSPAAEAVRNIIVSPLAGADAGELIDMRPIARMIETALATVETLWALPAKFGFVLDGGGKPSLDGVRADIRLRAVRDQDRVAVAVTTDGADGRLDRGGVPPEMAADAAISIVTAMLASPSRVESKTRLRQDGEGNIMHLGLLPQAHRQHPLALAAPFGRVEADVLLQLAHGASDAGCLDLRLSPWRALYFVAPTHAAAERLVARVRALALIVDASDPLLRVDACPGAPACSSATRSTRDVAHRVAGMLPGATSIHVSGCAKGCARSSPADLVLVADDHGYAVIRDGRASSPPDFQIAADRLDTLPALLAKHAEAARHA